MKRALIAVSLLLLAAAAWWALRPVKAPTGGETSPDDPVLAAATDAGAAAGLAPGQSPDAGAAPGPLPMLIGEVRDDTGGIAQAQVDALRRGDPEEKDCVSESHTTSVAGGSFDLGTLCPGQYDVRAVRGARVATAVARLARGVEHEPLFLLLRESTRLTVRVRDAQKAPLAGAKVSAQDEQSGYLAEAVSDAKGLAVIDGLMPKPYAVWGRKPGYLEASIHGRTLAAVDDQLDLTLTAGVNLEGRIVDPDGNPVDGVWVRLGTRRRELGGGIDTAESGTSRDGGEFSIGPVRPGSYVFVASHDAWQRLEQPVRVPTSRTTFKLGRGASIDGLFLDADGAPVAAGDVHAELEGQDDSRNSDLDAWGGFKLEGLGRGSWTLLGMTKSADGGAQGVALARVSVKSEQPMKVTLQLERGERIEGRCVSSDGSAADTDVIGVERSLYQRLRMSGFDPSRVPPGSVGISTCSDRFTLEGLKPGRYALLACGNEDDPTLANAGDRDVRVLCNEGELRFRVVDPARRPVEKFSLGISDWPPEHFPDGRFKRPLRGETDEVLTIRSPGFAPLQRQLKGKRGASIDLGELQLTPARKLAGRVTDARDSKPVSGADLRFGVNHEDAVHRARTGADGRFELVDVAREDGKLFVSHPSYRMQSVPVSATQAEVAVSLSGGLELSGAIITHDGREPRGYDVEARGPDGVTRTASVVDGRYTLGSLEPGDWKLRVTGADVSGFDPQTVTLVGTGAVSADFVERLGGVTFSVLPLDDEAHPVVASVWLVPGRRAVPATDADATALATSAGIASEGDPNGGHTFSSVAPGPYTALVRITEIPGMVWAESFEVNPGMASPLRLNMPRGLEALK